MQKCIKRKPRLTFQLSLYNDSASLRLLISSFIIKVILLLFSAVLLSIFPVDLQNYTYSSVPMCWDTLLLDQFGCLWQLSHLAPHTR